MEKKKPMIEEWERWKDNEEWTAVRNDGKKVKFTGLQISPGRAQMTATVEGKRLNLPTVRMPKESFPRNCEVQHRADKRLACPLGKEKSGILRASVRAATIRVVLPRSGGIRFWNFVGYMMQLFRQERWSVLTGRPQRASGEARQAKARKKKRT
jgi:hypothetical protein